MTSSLDTQQLATLLKAKRGQRGLREIAQEMGNVSPATLSRIENGKMLDVETFLSVCDWLQIAPQQFLKEVEAAPLINQAVRYRIEGGQRLEGSIVVQGAKNAVLPIIAASLLARKGQTILRNVPLIRDVFAAIEVARVLGAKITVHEEDQVLVIDASELTGYDLPEQLTSLFRASVLFVAPVLTRMGRATIAMVGGCKLGRRGLDFHYRGFARLGAHISEDEQRIALHYPEAPQGAYLYLDTPSHTGTENLMMAACLARGTTLLENAALEPEIADVAQFLRLHPLASRGSKRRSSTRAVKQPAATQRCACWYTSHHGNKSLGIRRQGVHAYSNVKFEASHGAFSERWRELLHNRAQDNRFAVAKLDLCRLSQNLLSDVQSHNQDNTLLRGRSHWRASFPAFSIFPTAKNGRCYTVATFRIVRIR